jgi:hypothetical protein
MFSNSNSKYYVNQALTKAVALKGNAGKAERLYIEASAAAEASGKKKEEGKQNSQAVQIHRKLVENNPKDLQAHRTATRVHRSSHLDR